MNLNNPLYKGQGIHVIASIFTVKDGKFKVLLIRRDNEPFKDKWSLVGGACYKTEDVITAMKREIKEKTGIKDIKLTFFDLFSKPDRCKMMRMLGVAYIGVIDCDRVEVLKKTAKTNDSDWFDIDRIPVLAYDHNEIADSAIEKLKELIFDTDILKSLFPKTFTLPELHKAYCAILGKEIDRRNFRKKMLSEKLIEPTGFEEDVTGKKKANLYQFV
jgi:8-oxo-dGTP diphosphatase